MIKKIAIIFLLIIIIIFGYLHFNDIKIMYKENWNINIPNPKKKMKIIDNVGAGDILSFYIMKYSDKDINYIKNISIFKQIDENIYDKYNLIEKNYTKFFDSKTLKRFKDNFNFEQLAHENNYYALLEKSRDGREYIFELMIIDVQSNQVYSLMCNYCF